MPNIFSGLKLDFGTPRGLALRVDTQRDINNLIRNEELIRRDRLDRETKAKLFADDFQFGRATNKRDHAELKSFSEGKIREIGKFINENPDFETDPAKRAIYKSMTGELLNNEHVYRSERVKAERDAMTKWINDPKNANLLSRKEIKEAEESWEQYVNTPTGKQAKEFRWIPPDPVSDIGQIASKWAKQIELRGMDNRIPGVSGMGRQYATEKDIRIVANLLAKSDGEDGEDIRHHYEQQKEQNPNLTLEDFVKEALMPFVPADKPFRLPTSATPGARGRQQGEKPNVFMKDVITSLGFDLKTGKVNEALNPGLTKEKNLPPQSLDAAFSANGSMDFANSYIFHQGRVPYQMPPSGTFKATHTGKVKVMPIGDDENNTRNALMREVWMEVPVEKGLEIESALLNGNEDIVSDITDLDAAEATGLFAVDEMDDMNVENLWSDVVEKVPSEDNPSKIRGMRFKVWVPTDPSDTAAGLYNRTVGSVEQQGLELKGRSQSIVSPSQAKVFADTYGSLDAASAVYGVDFIVTE